MKSDEDDADVRRGNKFDPRALLIFTKQRELSNLKTNSQEAQDRAEAAFKRKEMQAREGEKAMAARDRARAVHVSGRDQA